MALLGLAASNDVDVFHGPVTLETYKKIYADAPSTPASPFPLKKSAHTRLKMGAVELLEVPGSINGALGFQRWGYGLGSVSW